MSDDSAPTKDPSEAPEQVPLFQHTKRPQWGLAILAWERNGRRAFQFEDGKLRLIKDGYYHLMKEVDRPADTAMDTVAGLQDKLGVSVARREIVKDARAKGKKILTLQDQIQIFEILYPGGFKGEKWSQEIRGEEEGRRLKRHRGPAVEDAKENLSKAKLVPMLEEGNYAEIQETLLGVLKRTSLVRPVHLEPLKNMDESQHEAFALALVNYLHGEGSYAARFDAFVGAVCPKKRDECSWPLATAPAALLFPKQQVCVRPSSFRRQARWMAPRLEYSPIPEGRQYMRFRTMARSVHKKLKEAELEPRDLVDVYDFILRTLKPSAKKLLEN